MGREKKYKLKAGNSSAASPSSTGKSPAAPNASSSSMEVEQSIVPLPKEVMERELTLSLDGAHKPLHRTTMKKKHRRKQRHEAWLKKVDVFERAREKAKAAEERQKTVVVGDIHPLIDALPDIALDGRSENLKDKKKSTSGRRPHIMKEMDHFHEVLKHPAYVEDPLKTISLHIQNSIARGLT